MAAIVLGPANNSGQRAVIASRSVALPGITDSTATEGHAGSLAAQLASDTIAGLTGTWDTPVATSDFVWTTPPSSGSAPSLLPPDALISASPQTMPFGTAGRTFSPPHGCTSLEHAIGPTLLRSLPRALPAPPGAPATLSLSPASAHRLVWRCAHAFEDWDRGTGSFRLDWHSGSGMVGDWAWMLAGLGGFN